MRDLNELNQYRVNHRSYGWGDETGGAFVVFYNGVRLAVIASNGGGWDHVSVSTSKRCPTWLEMEHVKRLFFHPDECAMQLHVPTAEHINVHDFVLHIWRPHDAAIPMPPREFV
jgi:hypothetical protein